MMCRIRLVVFLSFMVLLSACASVSNTINDKDLPKASKANAGLGINYLRRGELDLAKSKLTKALAQDDNNASAHAGFAQLQSRVGNAKLADVHYKKATELEPQVAEHNNIYGVFLCEQGDIAKAVKQFEVAATNPYYKTPEYAMDNAGVCLMDNNQFEEANAYFHRALRRNNKFSSVILNLSDLNLRIDRIEVAEAYYSRYETYGKSNSRSLWLGYQIVKKSGDLPRAQTLGDHLLSDFSESKYAGEYLRVLDHE